MLSGQLQLDLDLSARVVPAACQYREDVPGIGRVLCHKDGRETYTNCTESVCGDEPHCAWEPLDNSPEAVARRLEWMKNHRKGTEE